MQFGKPCSPGTNIQMHSCLQTKQWLLSYLTISNSTTTMPAQAKRSKGRRRFLLVQPFREEHEGCFNITWFDPATHFPKVYLSHTTWTLRLFAVRYTYMCMPLPHIHTPVQNIIMQICNAHNVTFYAWKQISIRTFSLPSGCNSILQEGTMVQPNIFQWTPSAMAVQTIWHSLTPPT